MYDMTLAVKRGAYWLDSVYPEWAQRVDLDALNLNNCFKCVLGQIFAVDIDYAWGITGYHCVNNIAALADEDPRWDAEHGFNMPERCMNREGSWDELRDLWADQIIERRGGHVAD